MLEIDSVCDFLHTRVTRMAANSGFYYVDNPSEGRNWSKVFNLHTNPDDTMLPLAKLNSFLLQLSDDLAKLAEENKALASLNIEGPVQEAQFCFMNRSYHTHCVWRIALSF